MIARFVFCVLLVVVAFAVATADKAHDFIHRLRTH